VGIAFCLIVDHPFRSPDLATVSKALEPVEPDLEGIARRPAPDLPRLVPPLRPWVGDPTRPPRFEDGCLRLDAPAGLRMGSGRRAVWMIHDETAQGPRGPWAVSCDRGDHRGRV
jgi:hypothetical protein